MCEKQPGGDGIEKNALCTYSVLLANYLLKDKKQAFRDFTSTLSSKEQIFLRTHAFHNFFPHFIKVKNIFDKHAFPLSGELLSQTLRRAGQTA